MIGTMTKKIAIIAGAGPAGLTAAYELLARTDIMPIVCEATDVIGGIAQTHNYKGNRIDIGGHRFFSKEKRVMDWWFAVLPLQGHPSADTAEKGHEIDLATEAVLKRLCPECVESADEIIHREEKAVTVRRAVPDPEKEDAVMLQRPRLSRIFYRSRFFPYPIAITMRVALRLGIWNTFLIGLSYIKRKFFPLKDETYLDAFYKNRFGDRLYETFFRGYTEKVWGVKCGEIRADWGAQRVKGLSLKRAVTQAVKDLLTSEAERKQQERETSLITRFFYPKFGPGQMWETVAAQVKKAGGEVRMTTRVRGVKLTDGKVTSVTLENTATGAVTEEACDVFFSTMPIRDLCGMVDPAPPAAVKAVADGLQYRDFLTVGLLLKKLHVREKGTEPKADVPDTWIYIQDDGVQVGRVQFFNNWSPYMVADRSAKWIGLEYFVNEGGTLWNMPDQDLIDLGVREMEQVGLARREDLLDACVLRMRKAYPAYWGTYTELHVVRDFVERIPNLYLIGRNGMHRYNNQDHSMLTAMLAVDNLAAGRTDKANLWDVNLDMVYHESKEKKAD